MYTNVMLWRQSRNHGQEPRTVEKKTLVHENFRKIQLGINTSEENGFFS